MKRPPIHILFAILPLVLLAAGCGTRTIVVPVQRPATVDIHDCDRVAVPPTEHVGSLDPMALLVRKEVDAVLLPMLAETATAEFVAAGAGSAEALVTPRGTITRGVATAIARSVDADCLLACSVVRSSFHEDVLEAEIISNRDPGGKKFVRQGKASATFRILLIDAARETVTFADTLQLDALQERSAVNQEAPPLDRAALAQDLARRFASLLAEALRPTTDRQVVTFLVDDAWPELERAVALAEAGRWPQAAALIRSLLSDENVPENSDILWYDLGIALQYQHDFRGAKEAFERALEVRDRSRYRHAIDALLRMEEDYLESVRQQH